MMRAPAAHDAPMEVERRSAYLLWLIWVIWVLLMIPTIIGFLQKHPTPLQAIASLSGVVLFFVVYLTATLRSVRDLVAIRPADSSHSTLRSWLPLITLIVLGIVLAQADVQTWGQLFIYAGAYAGMRLPTRQGVWGVAVVFVITAFGIWRNEPSWSNFIWGAVFVLIIGVVVIILVRSRLTARDLRAAREEVARLAVTAERLRFARDLHDLLGHSLSLIALKTELARQLIDVDPKRTAAELDDIERAARESLREVREAVSGYRTATLASELHDAEKMLAAAGISLRCSADEILIGALSPAAEAALSWTVREGVTNVIRHSHAHHCHIRVMRAGHDAYLEIGDDGGTRLGIAPRKQAGVAASWDSEGNGLRGLAERVEALGGHFEAGPAAGGGFRLAVAVPAQHGSSGSKDSVKNSAWARSGFGAARVPAGSSSGHNGAGSSRVEVEEAG
jgi:two-component system, NarL family, sensor histidine kinase DesK